MNATRKILREFPCSPNRAELGWKRYIRGYQPLKKDGSDMKRQPHFSQKQIHVHPDGSYRVYNSNGVLCREHVSDELREAEFRNDEAHAAGC